MKNINVDKMYAAVHSDGGEPPSLYWMYLAETSYKKALVEFNAVAGGFKKDLSLGPNPVLLFVRVDSTIKYTKEKNSPLEYIKKEEFETITILKSIPLKKLVGE